MKSRRFYSAAKKLCCLVLALLLFSVPFMASAAPDDVPHTRFTVNWHRLDDNTDLSQEFPLIPTTMQIMDPVTFIPITVAVDNYMLLYRDTGSSPYYELRLFTEGVDPVSAKINTGVNVSQDEVDAYVADHLIAEREEEFMRDIRPIMLDILGTDDGIFCDFIYALMSLVYIDSNGTNFTDYLRLKHSSSSYVRWMYDSAMTYLRGAFVDPSSSAHGKFISAYDRLSEAFDAPVFTEFQIEYANPMSHYVLMQSYTLNSTANNWTYLQTVDLSSTRPTGYSGGFAGQVISSSFSKLGVKADGIIPGVNGVSSTDYENYMLNSLNENVKAPKSNPVPSWNENASGGIGSGSSSGGFSSGSWYNTGGTGNPFMAVLLAPWIGLQWTWNNVASRVSLFGVSIADVIITLLVLVMVYLLIKLIKPILS